MGVYGALTTAISGLRAQSFALQNISGNIANSQTVGYKRMETSFVDLVSSGSAGQTKPLAVLASSRATNDVRGDVITSASPTHVALSGPGYFVVGEKIGNSDGNSIIGDTNYFTRRGDFELDREGFLVNGSGYYLKGVPVDRETGNVAATVSGPIKIDNGLIPARATTSVQYELNLPLVPQTAAYETGVPSTELLTAGGVTYANSSAGITADEEADFIARSVEGTAITVYAENGAAVNLQIRWAKVDSAADGGTDTWEMFYLANTEADAADIKWVNAGATYTFGTDGLGDPKVNATTLSGVSVNGVAINDINIRHGESGPTQFDSANGRTATSNLGQNGYPAGEFLSVGVDDAGRVVATYSNGQQIPQFQIVTANFNAENMLKRMDGGVFAATPQSGEAIISAGGAITGGALETSNTDIAEEFTKLIVTQQAYAAGTRIVSTSDEMLREVLNMIR